MKKWSIFCDIITALSVIILPGYCDFAIANLIHFHLTIYCQYIDIRTFAVNCFLLNISRPREAKMTKCDPRSKIIQDSPIEWYPKRRQQDSSSSAIGNDLSGLPKQEQVTKRSLKPLFTYKICKYYKCVYMYDLHVFLRLDLTYFLGHNRTLTHWKVVYLQYNFIFLSPMQPQESLVTQTNESVLNFFCKK